MPLLPTFHGMESENPYLHMREFEEVCNTFKEETVTVDLIRLKLFPLTLKDKAKILLIQNWTEMQAEFLKTFFSIHRTNSLQRQISTFSIIENETSMHVGRGI